MGGPDHKNLARQPSSSHPALRIGVAHLFATGRNPERHKVIHLGGITFTADGAPPVRKDWILNPGHRITRRLFALSHVSNAMRVQAASWANVRSDITAFFEGLDMLFVADLDNHRAWFASILDREKCPPLVDLLEMQRFFRPERAVFHTEKGLVERRRRREAAAEGPYLPLVLEELQRELHGILESILSPTPEGHYLTYNLLHQAVHAKPPLLLFKAVYTAATHAWRINWGRGLELFPVDEPALLTLPAANRVPYGVRTPPTTFYDRPLQFSELVALYCALRPPPPGTVPRRMHLRHRIAKAFLPHTTETPLARTVEAHYARLFTGLGDSVIAQPLAAACTKALLEAADGEEAGRPSQFEALVTRLADEFREHGVEADQAVLVKNATCCILTVLDKVCLAEGRQVNVESLAAYLAHIAGRESGAETLRAATTARDVAAAQSRVSLSDTDDVLQRFYEVRNLEERPPQREYARFCASAMEQVGVYVAEAGTGTGKTLGYLIPGLEFLRKSSAQRQAVRNAVARQLSTPAFALEAPDLADGLDVLSQELVPYQVIIASCTKNLMTQIRTEELAHLVEEPQYQSLKVAAVLGKDNYFCETALVDLGSDNQQMKTSDARLAWLHLYLILRRNDGQWEGPPAVELCNSLPKLRSMAREVRAGQGCSPMTCPHCPYPQSTRRSQEADIIITNHHKLTRMRCQDFRPNSVLIVDEADQLAEGVRGSLTASVSQRTIHAYCNRLTGATNRSGLCAALKRRLQPLSTSRSDYAIQVSESTTASCRRILEDLERIEAAAGRVARRVRDMETRLPHCTDPVRWNELAPADHDCFDEELGALAERLGHIDQAWSRIDAELHNSAPLRSRTGRMRQRIKRSGDVAAQLADEISTVRKGYGSEQFVHTYAKDDAGWQVERVPFALSHWFWQALLRVRTLILTSASMFVHGSLDYFLADLSGRQEERQCLSVSGELQVASPFDYANRARGFVAKEVPKFRGSASHRDRDEWLLRVMSSIATLAVATYGRTLVLFTNTREMQGVYQQLAPVFEARDILPLLQNGASAAEIEKFRQVEHSVLFGVNRFWSGVDFPGPTLSQVIVVRLPYPPPRRPLISHRQEVVYGNDAYFQAYAEPFVRLRVKQGFGRLIRRASDQGLFVVLDERVAYYRKLPWYEKELRISLERIDTVEIAKRAVTHLGLTPEINARGIEPGKLYAHHVALLSP